MQKVATYSGRRTSNGMGTGYRFGDVEVPLEPVNSVFALSGERFAQGLPEGRLDVVELGENGESGAKAAGGSATCKIGRAHV